MDDPAASAAVAPVFIPRDAFEQAEYFRLWAMSHAASPSPSPNPSPQGK